MICLCYRIIPFALIPFSPASNSPHSPCPAARSAKMFDSVFGKSFNSGKCKTLLRLAMSRIKLLRNKRDIQLKQMKRELAQLMQSTQEPSARIRVEHVFREQNIMAAYEIIELFCELIVVRLPIIESQRQCPIDLREAVASLIFAAPRCADLPELQQIRNLFAVKYGKEFVAGAAELRPDCGVNRLIIEKLSVRAPSGEIKLKLMKEIAAEQNMDWDPTASESELLKAPEDLLEGPSRFLGASQMSLQRPPEGTSMKEFISEQHGDQVVAESDTDMSRLPDVPLGEKQFIPFISPLPGDAISSQSTPTDVKVQSQRGSYDPLMHAQSSSFGRHRTGFDNEELRDDAHCMNAREENFADVAAAARAAAESAERAASAARAAALLANGKSSRMESSRKFDKSTPDSSSGSDEDDFDDVKRSGAGSTEKYFKIQTDSFKHHIAHEKPVFDDDEDQLDLPKESFSPPEHGSRLNIDPHSDSRKYRYSSNRQEDVSLSSKNWQSQANDLKSQSVIRESSDAFSTSLFQRQQINPDPPQRPPPDLPAEGQMAVVKPVYVHPKLPDYDDLSARFEALRSSRR